jgi:hypothetical protein
MELSLSHLSLLIELTENEISAMKDIIDNPKSSEEEINDSGEHSMQLLSLASALAELYKEKWSSNCEQPGYKELINDIEQRRKL